MSTPVPPDPFPPIPIGTTHISVSTYGKYTLLLQVGGEGDNNKKIQALQGYLHQVIGGLGSELHITPAKSRDTQSMTIAPVYMAGTFPEWITKIESALHEIKKHESGINDPGLGPTERFLHATNAALDTYRRNHPFEAFTKEFSTTKSTLAESIKNVLAHTLLDFISDSKKVPGAIRAVQSLTLSYLFPGWNGTITEDDKRIPVSLTSPELSNALSHAIKDANNQNILSGDQRAHLLAALDTMLETLREKIKPRPMTKRNISMLSVRVEKLQEKLEETLWKTVPISSAILEFLKARVVRNLAFGLEPVDNGRIHSLTKMDLRVALHAAYGDSELREYNVPPQMLTGMTLALDRTVNMLWDELCKPYQTIPTDLIKNRGANPTR